VVLGHTGVWGYPFEIHEIPVRKSEDDLITVLHAAFKKRQINFPVRRLMLGTSKPYKAGNFPIWALDDLNIKDKHQLLVPTLKLLKVDGVQIENDKGVPVYQNFWIVDESCSIRLYDANNMRLKITDKGHCSAVAMFDVGVPFEGESVTQSLNKMAKEVSQVVRAFKLLAGGA